MQNYIEWLKEKGYRDNTIRRYISAIEMFRSWYEQQTQHPFEPQLINVIDINDWQRYLMKDAKSKYGKPYAVSSVINYIESIKTYFRYLNKIGLIQSDFDDIKVQKIQQVIQPKWLTRKEKAIFLNYINDPRQEEKNEWRYYRNLAMCFSMLMGGLRMSEVIQLNLRDVEDGYFFIRDGKGGKARFVPMNKDLRNILAKWKNLREERLENQHEVALFISQKGGRITEGTIRKFIDKVRGETSLKELTPHVLRHTFCHDLAEKGESVEKIAQLAGHSNINTTRIYTASSKDDLVKSVELLSTGKYNHLT